VPFNVLVVERFSSWSPVVATIDRYEGDHPGLAPLAGGGRLFIAQGWGTRLKIIAVLDDPVRIDGAWVSARPCRLSPFDLTRPPAIPQPRLSLEEVVTGPIELDAEQAAHIIGMARRHGYRPPPPPEPFPTAAAETGARARVLQATHANGSKRTLTILRAVGGGFVVLHDPGDGASEPTRVALHAPLGDKLVYRSVDLENGQRDDVRFEAVVDGHAVDHAAAVFADCAERAEDLIWADVEDVWG
jgi:hypothetical protein